MVKGIAHVCLGAADLVATERFYVEGLGFRKHFDFIRGGKLVGFYMEVAPMCFIEVFEQSSSFGEGPCPIRHVCFETADIDGVIGCLRKGGWEVSEKKLGGDKSWQCWTEDPSGVRIEFHQYTDRSAQHTGEDCVLG